MPSSVTMPCVKHDILIVALVLTIGCGQSSLETYRVQGKVTYDGAAVPTGMVMFVPSGSGQRVNGSIGPDGSYEVMAPAGSYKVAIIALEEMAPQNVTKENWRETFASIATKQYVPQVFSDTETSRLSYTVEPVHGNTYDISIPSPKRRQR